MNIQQLNAKLNNDGISTAIINTGGGVMACKFKSFDGDVLMSPSECSDGFSYGLYDPRDGEIIEERSGVSYDTLLDFARRML